MAAVPTTLVETAVPTTLVGTNVPKIIVVTNISIGVFSNNFFDDVYIVINTCSILHNLHIKRITFVTCVWR